MFKIKENILCWCKNPEDEAIKQAINLSKHPALIGNVCLMPDTHSGYGMPIGGVVALYNAVSPNMVGVDIGCGMRAVKTSLKANQLSIDIAKIIIQQITEQIPMGFNHNIKPQIDDIFNLKEWEDTLVCKKEMNSATYQLGSLGGGNHFIEIQKDDNGCVWFMIHSGSRNLGKKVCDFYNNLAKEMNKIWRYDIVIENDLAFLPKGTKEFNDYLKEMNLCLKFAEVNRKLICNKIKHIFNKNISCDFLEEIDIHHNYAKLENHYNKNVYVHRKGATLAKKDTIGIIPGSQGSCSYIVKGKGSKSSLYSCSHGAGRKMSRTQARKELSLDKEVEILNNMGIFHSLRSVNDLDEAPSSYKDIDVVMEEQKDLVDILVKLYPLAVIKS